MMLQVRRGPEYVAERGYILRVVLKEFLGLDFVDIIEERSNIEIQVPGDRRRLVLKQSLFAMDERDWLGKESLPVTPLDHFTFRRSWIMADNVPVIYGARLENNSFVEVSDDALVLGADLLGSSFFMLTRYEEAASPELDEHGRFAPEAMLATRERFLGRPVVNEYVELLWCALLFLWPRLQRRPRAPRLLVSHDVDWPLGCRASTLENMRAAAGDLVHGRDPKLALTRLASFTRARLGNLDADLFNTFDLIMDTSEARGLTSAFYFIVDRTPSGRIDGNHSIEEPWLRQLLRRIHERGHEIGLHPTYASIRDPTRIANEFEILRRICREEDIEQGSWGGRQHYLRWENPITWQSWADAGLSYDSSVGLPVGAGFRAGVCWEYPVFNLATRQSLALRERPLVAMDVALLRGRPTNKDLDEAGSRLAELKRTCWLFSGDFTLLWHNSRLASSWEQGAYLGALDA